jgi:hypothetical protein
MRIGFDEPQWFRKSLQLFTHRSVGNDIHVVLATRGLWYC